jgi:hypothetical protein
MMKKLLLAICFVPMLVIGELLILSIFLGLFVLYALDRIQGGLIALFRAVWPSAAMLDAQAKLPITTTNKNT